MPSDPEDLELRAVRAHRTGDDGDDVGPDQADDFAMLRRVGEAATSEEPAPERVEPPPELWARIEAAVTAESSGAAGGAVPVAAGAEADPIHLDDRRRGHRWARAAWIAAAAVVVASVIGLAALRAGSGDDAEIVARAQLERLADAGTASAELVRLDDGELRLDLVVDGVDPGDGFLELWLLGPGETDDDLRLISLGAVNGSGSYPVPAGLDLAAFPVVDISVEHFDGDPSHSGESVLRGELQA